MIPLPPRIKAAFLAAVWEIVQQIPPGRVATYGQIAALIPAPESVDAEYYLAFRARWVGCAMAECPSGISWQRVINSKGEISPRPGAENQRKLLEAEGIAFDTRSRINLKVYGY